jgi:hypothetical protein
MQIGLLKSKCLEINNINVDMKIFLIIFVKMMFIKFTMNTCKYNFNIFLEKN